MSGTTEPNRGWVLYDGQCGFCSRWLKFWQPILANYGFQIAHLQDSWVSERLGLTCDEVVNDLRLLWVDGKTATGADVYLQVARCIWWARPFYVLFSLPRFNRLIHIGYRWFAKNRYHISSACKLS